MVEGEKHADRLAALGLVATCNPGGAGKWRPEFNEHLRNRDIAILSDNDDTGRQHAHAVAAALKPTAVRVRVVELPGLPGHGDVTDWLAGGHSAEELQQVVRRTHEWQPQPPPDGKVGARDHYVISLHEFAGHEEPDDNDDEDWLIRDAFPRGAPSIMAGPMKSSKSIAMLDAAIAIALGEDWLGLRNTGGPRRALIMEQEDNARRTRARLWWLCRGRGMTPRDLDGQLAINTVDFWYPQRAEDEKKMRRSIEVFRPDIVFIDSLRRSLVGNENDSETIAAFGRVWLELCRDYGPSFCVLHHLKKNVAEGEA